MPYDMQGDARQHDVGHAVQHAVRHAQQQDVGHAVRHAVRQAQQHSVGHAVRKAVWHARQHAVRHAVRGSISSQNGCIGDLKSQRPSSSALILAINHLITSLRLMLMVRPFLYLTILSYWALPLIHLLLSTNM